MTQAGHFLFATRFLCIYTARSLILACSMRIEFGFCLLFSSAPYSLCLGLSFVMQMFPGVRNGREREREREKELTVCLPRRCEEMEFYARARGEVESGARVWV